MSTPEKLGKFQITGTLGKGGMGMVYRAFDPAIQRTVALKTIRKELIEDNGAHLVERFQNEARAAGRLNHPGIVAVYDYGEDADVAFIAMEYVEGCELRDMLNENRALPVRDACNIMLQLLDALGYAHARGVIHRDVKPANLIVTGQGTVKLADFGVARIDQSGLTQLGSIIGTPTYMAPEQYRGERIDHRADLFSAGVLLYEMLTRVRPFTGSTDVVGHKICNEPERKPSEVLEGLPQQFDAVIARALAKRAKDRFQDAAEFGAALRAAFEAAYDDQASGAVSEETVLLSAALRAKRAQAPLGQGRPTGTQPTPSHWQDDTLRSVERQLAEHIGPVARVHVRQAATRAADLTELYSLLADKLDTDDARRAFLSGARAASAAGTTGARGTVSAPVTPATPTPSASGNTTLDDAAADTATRLLALRVGPIANLLAKKARARAATLEEFHLLLADSLEPADRDAFVRDLRAQPKRK